MYRKPAGCDVFLFFMVNYLEHCREMLTFASAKMKKETVFRFDRDTHQINYENRERILCQWRATLLFSEGIAV